MVTASTPPDEQDLLWLRATAQGDRIAFASLYRRHHGRLARFLWRMTRRRDLIDDTINDTMWIVWRKADGFRGDSKVSTWITGIAYRCMLKALREAGDGGEGNVDAAALELAEGSGEGASDAARALVSEAADIELRDWLAEGLKRLPRDQRVTLELLYYMGESCEAIAAIMDCAVGTVKARLFHARMRLRNLLPALAEPGSQLPPVQAGTSRRRPPSGDL
jgi:RNA polymerase sigma-70 factor (ECF subfamily)